MGVFDGSSDRTKYENIKSVTIPNTVKKLTGKSFAYCANLETVNFEAGSNLSSISNYAFYYSGLKSITLPESVTDIDSQAFYYSALESISLPNNLKYIGSFVFSHTKIKSIKIPDSVTKIGAGAFAYTNLESLHIPNNVSTIGVLGSICITDGCYCLKEITIGSENENFYGNGHNCIVTKDNILLAGCIGTTIPETIERIADNAFRGNKIESIVIPGNVSKIGSRAFADCPELKSVTILSDNYLSFSENAFINCNSELVLYGMGGIREYCEKCKYFHNMDLKYEPISGITEYNGVTEF